MGMDMKIGFLRRCSNSACVILMTLLLCVTATLCAEDWPEWRGKGRLGIWNETGILEKFPKEGLKFKWRTPIKAGYAGPAVSNGKVFVFDFEVDPEAGFVEGEERLVCLDEETGEVLWSYGWEINYRVLMASYAIGPRATPTVDGKRVYALGATGRLVCVDVDTGMLIWSKDFREDYGTSVPTWGVTGAPLVHEDLLICIVGGVPDARVVAFDKLTGNESWRAIRSDSEMGYGQPVIFREGGALQLIIWHPTALASLNPESGKVYWELPFEVRSGMTVATPVKSENFILVSQFYGGSLLADLDRTSPTATELWKVGGSSERPESTAGLHALITTPIIQGDYIYGVCSYGQLRCLDLRTGKRVWESDKITDIARWAAVFMVRNGDRYFINNDRGELIIAQFSPDGYNEIDRTKLIEPTSNSRYGSRGGRRRPQDRIVNWSHPAYANRHIFARNDNEIICASLAKDSGAN
jgi:outer membrane protein assembly factor BamB